MNPICNECKVEMRCTKNSISVAHVDNPQWIRTGDQYTCPDCGTKIITDMGEPTHADIGRAMVMIEDCLKSDIYVEILHEEIDFMSALEELENNDKKKKKKGKFW